MPDQPETINDSPSQYTNSTATRSSIILAAVMGLVLLLLSIAGYALITESGLGFQEGNDVIEQQVDVISPIQDENDERSDGGENEDDAVFCTMDAKICPNGTAVGRTGPNCEFAPCPGE